MAKGLTNDEFTRLGIEEPETGKDSMALMSTQLGDVMAIHKYEFIMTGCNTPRVEIADIKPNATCTDTAKSGL